MEIFVIICCYYCCCCYRLWYIDYSFVHFGIAAFVVRVVKQNFL